MHCAPLWNVDSTKILTRRELATVLADLKGKCERQANVRRNLVIVRLACCCGLRVSEIGGLQLDDLILDVARPHMRLRRETTKGKKARCVPLWWDAGTLADLVAWKAERVAQGAILTGVVTADERALLWDNLVTFGDTASDAALTCTTYAGRVLGRRAHDDPLTHLSMQNVSTDRRHDRRPLTETELAAVRK